MLPLHEILRIVSDQFGGRVLEVELEEEDDHYIYELLLVTRDSRLIEVELDAAVGTILNQEYEDDDKGWFK